MSTRKLEFNYNPRPTLGVEVELALVDGRTMALTNRVQELLARLPEAVLDSVKPELMQCYLEINTAKCETVGEAESDLRGKLEAVERVADALGVRLLWAATHPFSSWREQVLTPTERYQALVNLLQELGRQLVTFGLHVHVGVDTGDKAIMICDRIQQYLPLLVALSANSPCWDGRVTGLRAYRPQVMASLPTGGLLPRMRNWSEFTWLVNHLEDTGYIHTIREIWWDVRPHHNFGTVEVRMCDLPGSLEDTLALVALVHCLVVSLSEEIDEGVYQFDSHPMMVRQNKWRAMRFGTQAELVDVRTLETRSVPALVEDLLARLAPIAERLDCARYLGRVRDLARGPGWADRQLQLIQETGDPAEAVRRLTTLSRLTPQVNAATQPPLHCAAEIREAMEAADDLEDAVLPRSR